MEIDKRAAQLSSGETTLIENMQKDWKDIYLTQFQVEVKPVYDYEHYEKECEDKQMLRLIKGHLSQLSRSDIKKCTDSGKFVVSDMKPDSQETDAKVYRTQMNGTIPLFKGTGKGLTGFLLIECERFHPVLRGTRFYLMINGMKFLFETVSDPQLYEERWTYEQVVENPVPFLESVGYLKYIPASRAILNFIFYKNGMAVSHENQKEFLKYLKTEQLPDKADPEAVLRSRTRRSFDKEEEQKKFSEEELLDLYQELTAMMAEKFRRNGYKGEVDQNAFFKALSEEKFDETKLTLLALGMHITEGDYILFLKKIFRRSGINFYDRNQLFIYVILKYASEFQPCFTLYDNLQKLYPEGKEKQTEDNCDRTASTQYIGSETDSLFENLSKEDFQKIFTEKNDAFAELVRFADTLHQDIEEGEHFRTANKCLEKMWTEFVQREDVEEGMKEIWTEERSNKVMETAADDMGSIHVSYDGKEEYELPENTQFTGTSAKEQVTEKVLFATKEKIHLPKQTLETISVCVRPLTVKEDFTKYFEKKELPADMKKLNKFVDEEFHNKLKMDEKIDFQWFTVDDEELSGNIQIISAGSRLKFFSEGKQSEYGIGKQEKDLPKIMVQCETGTYIPEGTKFYFETDGFRFWYESIRDANVREYSVRLTPLTSWNKELKEKKNTPVKMKEEFKIQEKEGNAGLIRAYTLRSKKLGLFADGMKENEITFVCERAFHLQEGTILTYTLNGKEYRYETAETLSKRVCAEKDIPVCWINKQAVYDLVKGSDSSDVEILGTDARVTCSDHKIMDASVNGRTMISLKDTKKNELLNHFRLKTLYDVSSENANSVKYYKGFPEYGEDYYLNTKDFKETRLSKNLLPEPSDEKNTDSGKFKKKIKAIQSRSEAQIRNDILTIKFLDFVWENTGDYYVEDFAQEVNEYLLKCGYMIFSKERYPYDGLLALLLNSNDPLGLFQALWSDKGILKRGVK